MKPSPFVLHEPRTLAQAVEILSAVAPDEGRVLAGGQTLVPAMNLRLARPSHLVDINRIDELGRVQVAGNHLSIGACVRHAAFHRPVVEGPLGALLERVARSIAHLPIRMRGTFCGSLANADAASEWCLASATLDAVMVAHSVRGAREIPASDFFQGFMATALEPDEILAEARLPLLPAHARFGFEEYSRRAGDFAQAMALAVIELPAGPAGSITKARIGVGGVESAPRRLREAESCLEGRSPGADTFAAAADAAAREIEPLDADQALRDWRRDLVRTVVGRALDQAWQSARGQTSNHGAIAS